MPETRRAVWREPLVHFLLAAAAIFAINLWRGPDTSTASNRIIVSSDQIERMVLLWNRTWGRQPTDEELQGLVRDFIKEEVYYREALKLGLDINDTAIRRRLRQKLEFLTLAELEASEPDQNALRAWYADHLDRYSDGPTFTFQQVYFKTGNAANLASAMARLADEPEAVIVGDEISLPSRFDDLDAAGVSRTFGQDFANDLVNLPDGEWTGPVWSGYGQHLVRVLSRTEVTALPFEDVREQVKRDWLADARKQAEAQAYAAMRAQYEIKIEGLEP